jgi:hypothetical protein
MTWLIDGLPAQLSFPHSRVSSPSKMDPFGLRSDPNPNWLPDTTPTPPSPPPSSSEFDEYAYFQPETRADDLHDVRSVRLAGWWLLCYPEAGGVVWYGVEHHAEDGPPFVITHVQDIYTVLRDRLEWLLYRPLYQLRGADLSLASYELRGANLSLASYDEPCSWRAFANYSHIAAPNRWPHLHTWPEYDRWTPFYYRDHGVFVPRPVTLLERIRYWWLDVYHPHSSQSYDGSTWWCFRCHLPDDAARLHAASLQCRTDESHRYAMLNTIGGLGHLAGNFADLLLLQRALRDVEQRRLYRWVPPTLPDDTSDEFRAATWSEFSIDAYLADARSGFGEWPTPSDWSPFFVHARSGYAPSPPDWPEPLSTPAASPSQSPPSSPPPPSPPPSPSSLLPSSPSYSPSPPHSPLPPHLLQSRHQAPPSHTPSPPPSPMSQPLCQHHRHSLPILASDAYQVVATSALVIMATNTLTLHPPVMSGHVGWFVYTAQREYIHANIRHYHCTTNSLAQWMWRSWRSLMVASSIAVLCRQTADAKDKQLTSIAEGVTDYHNEMHERRTRDGETLALPPAMPAPPDITHELYNFTLSSGTRQSRFGLTLPVAFTSLAGGLSSLEHEPFAPLRLSFDMLYDLNLHAPDFHYGHILKRFGMVMQLSMRVILRFLHIRAAFMGFSVSTRRGEYVDYGYNGRFIIPFARTTLICNKGPQRQTYTQECHPSDIGGLAVRMHQQLDEAFLPWCQQLRVRSWQQLVPDLNVAVGVQPDLLVTSGVSPPVGSADLSDRFHAIKEQIIAVAKGGGVIAFDTEGDTDVELVQFCVQLTDGSLQAIAEGAPWTTLAAVCLHPCTLLVWGGHRDGGGPGPDEQKLRRMNILMHDQLKFINVAKQHPRPDQMLTRHWQFNDEPPDYGFWIRSQTERQLPEAYAILRPSESPLYLKASDSDAFYFPSGTNNPSIWTRRPLAREHVYYAVADTAVLFALYTPDCAQRS